MNDCERFLSMYNSDWRYEMDIKIFEDIKNTFQVIIQCKKIDKEVLRLKKHIELFDKKLYAKKITNYF